MSGAWQLTGCLSWLLIGLLAGSLATFAWVCWMDGKRDKEWKAEFYPDSLAESLVSVQSEQAAA